MIRDIKPDTDVLLNSSSAKALFDKVLQTDAFSHFTGDEQGPRTSGHSVTGRFRYLIRM
jgi:hypothetical protein